MIALVIWMVLKIQSELYHRRTGDSLPATSTKEREMFYDPRSEFRGDACFRAATGRSRAMTFTYRPPVPLTFRPKLEVTGAGTPSTHPFQ